jgi:hypothetical protein
VVFGAPDPDRGCNESTAETARYLDCEAVPTNRIDQKWKVRPVLLNGPDSDDDGRDPIRDRSFDFGPRHLFEK